MNLDGQLSISRVSCGTSYEYIRIEFRDKKSGCYFVTATVELAELALALTGIGHVDCEIQLRQDAPVGKLRETKVEILPRCPFLRVDTEQIRQYLAPYEVDGWRASEPDLFNSTRWEESGTKSRVMFHRYVDE